jgi:hypothetical protein
MSRSRFASILGAVFCSAFGLHDPAFSQKPVPHPVPKVNTANIGILSVNSGTPLAGGQLTVTFAVFDTGVGNNSFTGYVTGAFQDQGLVETNESSPVPITVQPRAAPVTGVLSFSVPNAARAN